MKRYKLDKNTKTLLQVGDRIFAEYNGSLIGTVVNMWTHGRYNQCIAVTIRMPDKRHIYGQPISELYGVLVESAEE